MKVQNPRSPWLYLSLANMAYRWEAHRVPTMIKFNRGCSTQLSKCTYNGSVIHRKQGIRERVHMYPRYVALCEEAVVHYFHSTFVPAEMHVNC